MTFCAIRSFSFLRRPSLAHSCARSVLPSQTGRLFARLLSSQAADVDESQPSNSKQATEQHDEPSLSYADFVSSLAEHVGKPQPSILKQATEQHDALSVVTGNALPRLELPPPISGFPTPWFDKEDFEAYVRPLYSRGWGLTLQQHRKASISAVISSVLMARFPLTNFDAAMAFMADIGRLANSENHHPTALSFALNKPPVVMVKTLTHGALRPDWIGASPPGLKILGVTRRDLRLAVLIDHLYTDKYENHEPRLPMGPGSQLDLDTLIKFFSFPPESLRDKCAVCGDNHPVLRCRESPTMASNLPYLPFCKRCRQRHAPMSKCPRGARQVKPPSPCPNCGGAHWLEDCREAQLPTSEGERMQLPIPRTSMNLTLEAILREQREQEQGFQS